MATSKKAGRPRPERFTVDEVAEALSSSKGIIAAAAAKLGTSRQTVYEYVQRHPELAAVRSEATDATLDFAESRLLEGIEAGNLTAIIFYLKTKGKQRGYVERAERTGADGGPIKHLDLTKLSVEQLENLHKILEAAA